MTDKPFKSETRTAGPLRFLIEWFYDVDGDTSWLGEPTSKPNWDGAVYDLWTDHLKIGDTWYDENGRALTESDYEELEAHGDSRKHRYVDGFQHSGTAGAFAGCDTKQCQEAIDKYGSLDQANRSYIFADVKRLKAYWSNHWWMTGCRVTLTVDGEELAQYSLWGIESDSDDAYTKEVEAEQISECKAQALSSLPMTVERLNKLIHVLVELAPKELRS